MSWKDLLSLNPDPDKPLTPSATAPSANVPATVPPLGQSWSRPNPSPGMIQGLPVPTQLDTPTVLITDTGEDAVKLVNSLKEKTDFDTTEVGKKIKGITDNLPDTMQPRDKIQTALKIGAAMGITLTGVLTAVTDIKNALASEKTKFEGATQQFESREVTDRSNQIDTLSTSIKQKEQELADARQKQITLSVELADKQNVLARRSAQFKAAFIKRSQEIDTLAAYYQSFVPGAINVNNTSST